MKKNVKSVLVLLAAMGLLLCLCGCEGLEQMRKNQAFRGENGEILWNGTSYMELPANPFLTVETNYSEAQVLVTAEDVPVLLSPMLADAILYPDKDGVFLEADVGRGIYYCREDRYAEILQRLQEDFVPELFCYSYGYPEEQHYTLTQEQVQGITEIMLTQEPMVLSEGMSLDWEYFVDLEARSGDMLFRKAWMGISVCGSTYYLHPYDDGERIFAVPEAYNDMFGEITRAYIAAMEEYTVEPEDAF